MKTLLPYLACALFALVPSWCPAAVREGEMAGYLLIPNDKVPEPFNAGFSMYVAAWPLLRQYPGQRFQSGLPGTCMFAQHEGKGPTNAYSDIEGGLGWWRDTEYATETPKFIMGGVAGNCVEWANGPGAGKGRDWAKPQGKYAIAQLSPWLLWPPDGLNLKQGTRGEWFGYSSWKKPGPKAGPFKAQLGDGSVVTYSWYRFADQPSLLNADLTGAEREAMQVRVEKLHRHWKKDQDYLAPPTSGKLAELDPALVVTPPPGLEFGYVPIVTRQEPNAAK